jgi:hypothetical protein
MASDRKGFSNSIGGARGSSQVGSSSISEGDGRSRTPDSERGAGSIIDGPYGAPNGILLRGKPSIVDSGKGIRPKVKYPTAPGVSSRSPGPIKGPSSGGKQSDPLR